ncbi:hypothetical protein MMC10_006127 [Thelotrema lepadinum]|nr:hypothetical protein [Thelotrema lepadinum]
MSLSIDINTSGHSDQPEESRFDAEVSNVDRVDFLLSQCQSLYSSVCDFQAHITSTNKIVDVRTFRNAVASEVKSVQRLLERSDPYAPHVEHGLRSTNLPFLRAIWDTAKRCQGVTSLSKRVFPSLQVSSQGRLGRKGILVDIVANDGLEWVKVSTLSERSLLHELARAGWERESESEDEEIPKSSVQNPNPDHAGTLITLEQEDKPGEIDLVRVVAELTRVAQTTKVRYRHPSIRVVLPKIVEGSQPVVDRIIQSIRATGAVVQCNLLDPTEGVASNLSSNEASFAQMAPSPLSGLTSTLNLDCTILLAFISDISHLRIPATLLNHEAINKQIATEATKPLLPTTLYPTLSNRRLACADIAARRMRDIALTIGTPQEIARLELVLGEGRAAGKSARELREELSVHSEHSIPEDLLLPIWIESGPVDLTHLPSVAAKLKPQLSEINCCVFLLGWARGWTTITSNRTVARQIEQVVEAEQGEVIGPEVWVCTTARSLIGKEKGLKC